MRSELKKAVNFGRNLVVGYYAVAGGTDPAQTGSAFYAKALNTDSGASFNSDLQASHAWARAVDVLGALQRSMVLDPRVQDAALALYDIGDLSIVPLRDASGAAIVQGQYANGADGLAFVNQGAALTDLFDDNKVRGALDTFALLIDRQHATLPVRPLANRFWATTSASAFFTDDNQGAIFDAISSSNPKTTAIKNIDDLMQTPTPMTYLVSYNSRVNDAIIDLILFNDWTDTSTAALTAAGDSHADVYRVLDVDTTSVLPQSIVMRDILAGQKAPFIGWTDCLSIFRDTDGKVYQRAQILQAIDFLNSKISNDQYDSKLMGFVASEGFSQVLNTNQVAIWAAAMLATRFLPQSLPFTEAPAPGALGV